MIEVRELSDREIKELLGRIGYGHLACCRDSDPYVVPIHYAWDGETVFIYTTEGKKSEILAQNPKVCLQLEEVEDNRNWRSVIVEGVAEKMEPGDERSEAIDLVMKSNPTLTPAISIRWLDNWVRENVEVVYRIKPERTSGRASVAGTDNVPFVPRQDRTI